MTLNQLTIDRERVVLFTAGILVTIAFTLLIQHAMVQEYLSLMDQKALASLFGRIDPGSVRLFGTFSLFLVVVVLRPSPIKRYYYTMFVVMFGTYVLLVMMEESPHPTARTPSTQSGPALFTPSHQSGAPNGTVEKWAQVVRDLPAAMNKEIAAYNADIGTIKIRTADMLASPKKSAAMLKRGHQTIERHRAAFAKIIADARAVLQAEQQGMPPSPILKMHEERAAHQGEAFDRDLAQYDRILTEYDALLRDLSHSQGQIDARDDSIYFSVPEDHQTYRRHVNRLERLEKERRAARQAEASNR